MVKHLISQHISLGKQNFGAGRGVIEGLVPLRARRIVYVACDPAALARDAAHLLAGGYDLVSLRALDAFPMTHHVECVAVFEPRGAALG